MIENTATAAAEIENFYMYFSAGKVFIPIMNRARSGARLSSDAGLQASGARGVSLHELGLFSPGTCRLNGNKKYHNNSK
jgi:hypothetical protein